jgi:2-polyprenyl-6-hydroxyphenyl methylase/3-demethylubiquinone-9 3-methyltransferase
MTTELHSYDASNLEPTRENKKIYAAILDQIRVLKPTSVLEVGSGMGMLGDEIRKMGIRYVGIEPDAAQLGLCSQRYPELNVVEGSCYEPAEKYGLGEFDLVFSTDVIEHLFLPRHLVSFKKAHVRKGGHVLTCTPEFGSYWKNILYSVFNKWDIVHSPLWDGGHIKFFSRRWMRQIFEEQSFVDFQWGTVRNVNIPVLPMSMICICRRP